MGIGFVQQLFSFCKYTDTYRRHAMIDNASRVAFMAHYNGDVEGRLDQMPMLKALVQCTCYVLFLVLEKQPQFGALGSSPPTCLGPVQCPGPPMALQEASLAPALFEGAGHTAATLAPRGAAYSNSRPQPGAKTFGV